MKAKKPDEISKRINREQEGERLNTEPWQLTI